MSYPNQGTGLVPTVQEVRRGGRPRDGEREGEILGVVASLLAERGYEGPTFEEVARRAGASKATLYQRWSSKRDMVVAALKAGPARREGADGIDTGSLRGDLLALCQRLLTTMRSADGQTALLLLQAGIETLICARRLNGRSAQPEPDCPGRSSIPLSSAVSCPTAWIPLPSKK